MKKAVFIIKWILMSALTLIVGFSAVALPFKLFNLSGDAVRYFFLIELGVYFFLSMLYLVSKQKKKEKAMKEKRLRLERREKFQKAQEEYYSLAA